jgi:elongation factor 1 alpha-like protein
MSKLQALAAARKKKAQEQKGSTSEVEKPMANLSLSSSDEQKPSSAAERTPESADSSTPKQRGFPLRKRKDSNPHEKISKQQPSSRDVVVPESSNLDASPVYQAPPSAFASTMFQTAEPRPAPPLDNKFTMPYISNPIAMPANPFAGPSPDDVVIAAQSKGSTHSARSKS